MKRIFFAAPLVLAVAGFASAQAPVKNGKAPSDSCVNCHQNLPGRLGNPVKKFKKDIHAQNGLSCASCHGGDSKSANFAEIKSKAKGYIGRPKTANIPGMCAKCHSDLDYMRKFNPAMPVGQLSAYKTSVHGKRLAQGDTKVATCASCHGSHGILPASNVASTIFPPKVVETCAKCHSDKKYMKGYKIPTNQAQEYLQSVHAEMLLVKRDFSAPTCNDCHGNHGAFPPTVHTVSGMCGQCHVNNRNLFDKSLHQKAFYDRNLPECAVCHSNHKVIRATDKMIGDKPPSVCISCHAKNSGQLKMATDMRGQIEGLKKLIGDADAKLETAEHLGMEVSDAKFSMKQARTALIQLRTEVHTFTLPMIEKKAEEGKKVAKGALKKALAAIEEFNSRRVWVFIPILLTIFLVGALYLKLRDIESGEDEGESS
jgi:predicted CXXCH cytochrome family protein